MGTMWEVCRDVERQRWSGGGGSAGGLTTVYKLAICIEWTGRGDINSSVSPLSSVRTVLGGKNEDEGTVLLRHGHDGGAPSSTVVFNPRGHHTVFVVVASSSRLRQNWS
jgi:hypothetical protein